MSEDNKKPRVVEFKPTVDQNVVNALTKELAVARRGGTTTLITAAVSPDGEVRTTVSGQYTFSAFCFAVLKLQHHLFASMTEYTDDAKLEVSQEEFNDASQSVPSDKEE